MENINQFTKEEQEIIQVLNKVADEGFEKKIKGDKQWTIRIKQLLSELGLKKEFQVCTSGLEDNTVREWLYDYVWYKENENNKMLYYVPLVLECEWGRVIRDIKFDFEKLLLANSEMRFMICQAKQNKFDDLNNYFEEAVKNYRDIPKGSRFVTAILDDCYTGYFKYKLIIKE